MGDLTQTESAVNALHGQGFCVIPVPRGSKKRTEPWKEYQQRRPTPEELRQWFGGAEKNLALVCGAVSGGLAVLDIDDTALAARIADDVALQAETTLIRTPSGGLHVYVVETEAASRSGPLVPGVADLKGEGGYVLAPPSVIGGREYTVLANTTIKHVPNAREWAIGLLRAYDVEVPEEQREPLSLATMVEEMAPGNRNVSLFKLACKLKAHGLSDADLAAFVRQTGREAGLPDREVNDILRSVARYPSDDGDKTLGGPVLVALGTVQREEVRWLWPARIPLGRLTGIVGDPGVGKSWLTLAVGTAITTGAPLPGQDTGREPGNVLLLTAEDGLADTVRPRMEDMDADLARVTVLTAVRDGKGNERHPSLLTDMAGADWPQRAGRAALALSLGDSREDDSLGVRLLGDVRMVFEERGVNRIASGELVTALVAMEEAPWGDLKGKALDARGLARMVRRYGIRPRTIRLDDDSTSKGYHAEWFADAWARYLSPVPPKNPSQASRASQTADSDRAYVTDVTDVTANSDIQEPPHARGQDDDGRHLYMLSLAELLEWPHVSLGERETNGRTVSVGIPGGRFAWQQAARFWPDDLLGELLGRLEEMYA